MASSIREQVLQYLVDRLNEVADVSAARYRLVPLRKGETTNVLVRPVGEQVTAQFGDAIERRLEVQISIIARATTPTESPDQVADPIASALYAKLFATDTTQRLGGLLKQPMQELSRSFEMADADGTAIDYQINIAVTFWTTVASETIAG